MVTLTGKSGLTTIVIGFDVAGLFSVQRLFDEVRTQKTISPFTGVYVKPVLFDPTFAPFTFHWYAGVDPPFTGKAVNVTVVPAQTVFADEDMVTPIGTIGLTIMVMVLEFTGLFVVHVMLEVSKHVTWSPFNGIYENTEVLVPELAPFIFH